MKWGYFGAFPNGTEENAAVFYGTVGISSFCGNPLPAGSVSPLSKSISTDDSVTLTCTSVNTLGYQWEHSTDGEEWEDISGANYPEYSIYYPHEEGVIGSHKYRCKCIGLIGSTYTQTAEITVSYRQPSISARITRSSITPPATVKLVASERKYSDGIQWQERSSGSTWEDIPGATTDIYSIDFVFGEDLAASHAYRAKVSGLGGDVYSDTLYCEVSYPSPAVTASASETSVLPPKTITLSATATNADKGIRWQEYDADEDDYVDIPGATSETLEVSFAYGTPLVYHYYRCVASGYGGTVASAAVSVAITYRPPTVSVTASQEGNNMILTAATQHADNGVKWQKLTAGNTWDTIAGETENTLTIPLEAGTPAGTYYYRCVAFGYGGVTNSDMVRVIISYEAPTAKITSSYTEITAPGSITFGVVATYAHIGVQWEHSSDGQTWTALSGKTGATLVVEYTAADRGSHHYRCIATGYGGNTASNVIAVKIN